MPPVLKRRHRRSLRLDHHSKMTLASKVTISPNLTINTATSPLVVQGGVCSRPSSKHKARLRPRLRGRYFYAPVHSQVPGAILPIELLLHIFHLGTRSSYDFPVIVSQVCSYWRILVLHTPSLWRVIRPDGRRTLCAKQIRRSRGLPLHIEITTPRESASTTSVWITAHLRMACTLPAIRRWRSLSIRFDNYSPFLWNSILSSLCVEPPEVASSVPELESLSLIYPANDDPKEFHLFGDHAPKLRNVTLHGIRLRCSAALFENIVFLDYTHHGFNRGHAAVEEILSILAVSLKSLASLCIRFPVRNRTAQCGVRLHHSQSLVELQRLKQLRVRAEGGLIYPREVKLLVSKLVLPSLMTLELDAMDNTAIYSCDVVRSVIGPFRQHTKVENLLVGKAWDCQQCIDCFARSLPSLSTLGRT